MQTSDSLHQMYESLASRYAHEGEARQRDHCLVLAADAALTAGQPDQAERLRKRLLLTNPHHLLRPFASMSEAMQSTDVLDYVADLRRQWPPPVVEKLLRQMSTKDLPLAHPVDTYPIAEPAVKAKPAAPRVYVPPSENKESPTPSAPSTPPTPSTTTTAGFWLAMGTFLLGLVLAGGVLFLTFAGPMWEE